MICIRGANDALLCGLERPEFWTGLFFLQCWFGNGVLCLSASVMCGDRVARARFLSDRLPVKLCKPRLGRMPYPPIPARLSAFPSMVSSLLSGIRFSVFLLL